MLNMVQKIGLLRGEVLTIRPLHQTIGIINVHKNLLGFVLPLLDYRAVGEHSDLCDDNRFWVIASFNRINLLCN